MGLPRSCDPNIIPKSVEALVAVLPRLVEGSHPALCALQAQVRGATIRSVEMTGVGFYAYFQTPSDVPRTEPADFEVLGEVELVGVRDGADCVVFVRDGRFAWFEATTRGEDWPTSTEVLAVTKTIPSWSL